MTAVHRLDLTAIFILVLACSAVIGAAPGRGGADVNSPPLPLTWKKLPSVPDREGFAGSYAGVANGALLVAGGANFPAKRPWEGGTKIWYDRVFVLEPGAAAWCDAGRLPRAGGYGVSVTVEDGAVWIGGGDAAGNFADVWLARWNGREVAFTRWPSLPRPLAMAAGALVGRTLFVAGGLDRPDATQAQKVLFSLELDRVTAGWRELPAWPGPERFLATAGAEGGAFYLFGGAKLFADAQGKPAREWLRDAYCYTPGAGWKRLADLPRVAVAAPTPAPVVEGKLLVIGGDDGAQAARPQPEHQGFPRDVLAYEPTTTKWSRVGEVPFSLVTTTLTIWRGEIVITGGEAKPGVRSTEVWAGK